MKLYYSPGTCSLSAHITLREAGAEFDLVHVDKAAHTTPDGGDYLQINPKGYVPALQLEGGEVLTEGAAIVQFVADRHPDARLVPLNGTLERTRLQAHLNFIASELHKAFSPFFNPAITEEARQAARVNLDRRLGFFEQLLSDGRPYLMGERFSIADAYLFAIARWTGPTGIGLKQWPNLAEFIRRVSTRPSVQAALRAEGLIAA